MVRVDVARVVSKEGAAPKACFGPIKTRKEPVRRAWESEDGLQKAGISLAPVPEYAIMAYN